MSHINNHCRWDNNGAYVKKRYTTKLYCQVGDETKEVREENGKFYYNVERSYNSYERKYVSPDHVIMLKRSCCLIFLSTGQSSLILHCSLLSDNCQDI